MKKSRADHDTAGLIMSAVVALGSVCGPRRRLQVGETAWVRDVVQTTKRQSAAGTDV